MNKNNIYSLGGTVQASKGIYIRRQADEKLLELCKQGEFSYVLTSRQMGKSSLMINTASELKKVDIKSVIIDLTGIGTNLTIEQWYLGLLLEIEEELDLDTDVGEWWEENGNVGVTQRLTKFFKNVLLEEVESSVVVFVDEIDTTLSLDFTDDFFAAIRRLYLTRAQDAKFERLSFVLIGVATPGDLIRDPKRTPFNIGKQLDLTDFSFDEAMPLAEGLGLAREPAQQVLRWVLHWTGGHPYLTQRLCSVISEQCEDSWSDAAVKQVITSTFFGTMSQQDNNLQFVRDMLTKSAPDKYDALSVYREIYLDKRPVFDDKQSRTKSHLKLSGVVQLENNLLRVRNRIYMQVFNRKWIHENLFTDENLLSNLQQNRRRNIYSLGGTVQASKGTYIYRQADKKILELCQQGELTYILTSRQTGKSSLMINTASELKKTGIKSVIIDLTKIGTQVSVEQWYLAFLLEIEEQLDLDTDVEEWWEEKSSVGVTQRLTNFFQNVLLEEVVSPVVMFVDEIDTTLSLDFTDDFFAAIRYFYEARAQDARFEQLSFVLIGVATPGDLIRDSKRTPFNVGQRLDLTDFSFEEAIPLAEGLGLEREAAQKLLSWVLEWTGGHPYLTQRLCSIISEQGKNNWSNDTLERVLRSTFLGTMSKQDNNLQFVRHMLTKRAPNQVRVLTVYREICLGSHPVVDEEQSDIKSHLKLSGVVRRQDDALVVRNRIYQEVFNVDWVENELAQKRPYSQALMAWLVTNGKNESRLLRGQALQDALVWARDKSLGNADYQFLTASQELDKREIQFALAETKKEAEQIVTDAQHQPKRTIRISLGILAVAIVLATGAIWYSQKQLQEAQEFENKGKAERLVSKANSLVRDKKIKEAITAYADAQKLYPQVEVDADTWNWLCREGSLNELAQEVMLACENAVKLAPDTGYIRDSRGVARALTGDYKGAIADFEAFITETNNQEYKTQRQKWVKALRKGENPFTEEELGKLWSQ